MLKGETNLDCASSFAKLRDLLVAYRAVAVAFLLRSAGALVSMISSVVLVKVMGAESAGQFFFYLAIILFVSTTVRMGFDNIILRYSAMGGRKRSPQSWNFIGLAFVIVTVMCFLILSISFLPWAASIFSYGFRQYDVDLFKLMLFGIFPFSICILLSMFHQGRGGYELAILIGGLLQNTLLVLAVYFLVPSGIEQVVKIYLVVQFFVLVFAVACTFKRDIFYVEGPGLYDMLKKGGAFWVIAVISQYILMSGQIYSGLWLSPVDVTAVVIINRIMLVVGFLVVAINMVFGPKYAKLYGVGDFIGLKALGNIASKIMTLISVPALIIIVVFAEEILGSFDESLVYAKEYVYIFAAAQIVNSMTGSVGMLLMMTGNEGVLRNNMIFCALLLVVLCPVATEYYGMRGLVICCAFVMPLQQVITSVQVKRKLGFYTLSWVVNPWIR